MLMSPKLTIFKTGDSVSQSAFKENRQLKLGLLRHEVCWILASKKRIKGTQKHVKMGEDTTD